MYSRNKVMAHNIFAVPVFTLTFGILDRTKEEVHNIDTRTRKILTCTGIYHKNGSVDRLYTKREVGGRGLNSIFDVFVISMISTTEHLKSASESNKYIKLVIQHEKERLMRVSTSLCNSIVDPNDNLTQKISTKVKNAIKDNHKKTWVDKNQHGFITTRQK